MWRMLILVSVVCVLLGAGCTSERTTTVVLRNQTNFTVDVELFFDEEQDIPEFLLEETGTRLTFSIPPGGVESFSRPCEDLQAIFINDADMRVLPGVSPEASTRVYREPNDFTCGNTLTFTFTQNILATSLQITFSLEP